VAFYSLATNLVSGDANFSEDVFVRGPLNSGARLDLPANQWRLIALPLTPGASPADQIANVFGDDLTGAYGADWRVYGWDETTQQYTGGTYLPSSTPLVQGEGYWVKRLASETGNHLDMTGALRVASSFDVVLVLSVAGGWNLVGNPYEYTVDWADVRVVYDSVEHDLTQAQTDGKMSRVMYTWNGTAYQAFNGMTPGAMGTLAAWDGLWVRALASGVTLRVYGAPSGGDRGVENLPRGWHVRLTAASGDSSDPGNLLGMLEGARPGYDGNDLEEMAPISDDFLTVVFPHPEWGARAGDYTTDFRPLVAPSGQGLVRWAFEVRSLSSMASCQKICSAFQPVSANGVSAES
jgi:hypothetical protein